MMMSKPAPEKAAQADGAKKKTAGDAVADLERRLAMLGETPEPAAPAAAAPQASVESNPPVEQSASSEAKGGKNALLARIMAAQERAKQAQPKQPDPSVAASPAAPDFDLLNMAAPAAPPAAQTVPPPSFDLLSGTTPPPAAMAPPPAFDDFLSPPAAAPPAAAPQWNVSAPSMDDLMEHDQSHLARMEPVAPPAQQQEESLESIIGAIEGLSEEEKRTLLEEQSKIMASIENNKSSEASRKADAFESRSFSAAVQSVGSGTSARVVGSEKTKKAIEDGTAVVVQCLSCQNMMQVTNAAALMFCPVCQVVSPVEHLEGIPDDMGQMKSDLELAEKLQKEEYKRVELEERAAAQKRARDEKAKEQNQSWGEWLGLSSGSKESSSPERPPSFAQRPLARGEVGVSRPPGSGERDPRLASATTGEEPMFSNNHSREDELLSGGARVAESKPLFNCVADSVFSAANTLSTAIYNPEDEEGNVHGVDNSSLLAVPNVSRSDTAYKSMD